MSCENKLPKIENQPLGSNLKKNLPSPSSNQTMFSL